MSGTLYCKATHPRKSEFSIRSSILSLIRNFDRDRFDIHLAYYYGGVNLDNIANVYCELFPDKVEFRISETDLICEHVFDRVVSCPKKLSPKGGDYQPIAWHSDSRD